MTEKAKKDIWFLVLAVMIFALIIASMGSIAYGMAESGLYIVMGIVNLISGGYFTTKKLFELFNKNC